MKHKFTKHIDNEKSKSVPVLVHLLLGMAMLAITHPSFANRLEDAAMRGQSIVISVGQITAVIGLVIGGIFMSVGMANLGSFLLKSGAIGAVATFGAPIIIDVIKEVAR